MSIVAVKCESYTSGYAPIYGIGDMRPEAYVAHFKAKGIDIKTVPDDFDFGQPCTPPLPAVDERLKATAQREAVLAVLAALRK